jgi:hypothetical protein
MNTKMLKGIGVAISLLVGIGAASPALATVPRAFPLAKPGCRISKQRSMLPLKCKWY